MALRLDRTRIDLALLRGLALAVAILLFFGWLSGEVLEGGTRRFDALVRNAVHQHASPVLTWLMHGVTFLGSPEFLFPVGLLVVLLWVRHGRRRAAMLFLVTMLGAVLLDAILKQVFHRARPQPFFGLAAPASYSYPSGHALISCCFYGVLAALGARHPRAV